MTMSSAHRGISVPMTGKLTSPKPAMDPDYIKYNGLSRDPDFSKQYPIKTLPEFEQMKSKMTDDEREVFGQKLRKDYEFMKSKFAGHRFQGKRVVP